MKAWLNTNKQRVHQDKVVCAYSAKSLHIYNSDKFFISLKHYIIYIFECFKETKKRQEKAKKKKIVVLHRQTGNYVITSEIRQCSKYLSYYKKVVLAKSYLTSELLHCSRL